MKKIPTLFLRDTPDMSQVTQDVKPRCAGVVDGQGQAHRKLDGMCCMIDSDKCLWKRREVKEGKPEPEGFKLEEEDPNTGKKFGWVLVNFNDPQDQYFAEAWKVLGPKYPGTYELVGPKIQGNAERQPVHQLMKHSDTPVYVGIERTYEGIKEFLRGMEIEGLVFHHPDGRMAKIKKKDFVY